jgi:hypothetical protein
MRILKNYNLLILLPALLIMVGCSKYSDDETYTFDNCIEENRNSTIFGTESLPSLLDKYSSIRNNYKYSSLKDKHSVTVNVQEKLLKIDGEVLPEDWIEQVELWNVDGYVLRYTNPKRVRDGIPAKDDLLLLHEITMELYDSGEAVLNYELAARGYWTNTEQSQSKLPGLGGTYEKEYVVQNMVTGRYVCSESE